MVKFQTVACENILIWFITSAVWHKRKGVIPGEETHTSLKIYLNSYLSHSVIYVSIVKILELPSQRSYGDHLKTSKKFPLGEMLYRSLHTRVVTYLSPRIN